MWRGLVLVLWLAVAGLASAFSPPVVLPLNDTPEITIDATWLDIATGTISQAVTFLNPRGAPANRQVLRIELTSATPQPVRWQDHWQARHGLSLPTTTTGQHQMDLWIFEYLGGEVWSFIGTTHGDPVPVPPPAR